MPFVVEDGTGVVGANTYILRQDVIDYATPRGVVLPVDETLIDVAIYKAMDWFESLTFFGSPVDVDQALEFPREDLTVNSRPVDAARSIDIATKVLLQATIYYLSFDLSPVHEASIGDHVSSEKVGDLEVSYFAKKDRTRLEPIIPLLEKMLSEVSTYGRNIGRLNVIRT